MQKWCFLFCLWLGALPMGNICHLSGQIHSSSRSGSVPVLLMWDYPFCDFLGFRSLGLPLRTLLFMSTASQMPLKFCLEENSENEIAFRQKETLPILQVSEELNTAGLNRSDPATSPTYPNTVSQTPNSPFATAWISMYWQQLWWYWKLGNVSLELWYSPQPIFVVSYFTHCLCV